MTLRRKRLLCLLLACALAVPAAGCSKKEERAKVTVKEETDQTVHAVGIDEGELTSEAIVMAVGEKAVSSAEAMFYLDEVRRRYEPAMGQDIWGVSIEDGESLLDYVKDSIISEITEVKIICQEAQRRKVSLTDDELLEAEQLAEDYLAANTQTAARWGITKELAENIYADHMLADKMFDITTARANEGVTDEAARQVTVQVLSVLKNGADKNGAWVSLSEEEKKKAQKRIKELRKEAGKSDNFFQFAEKNSDGGQIEQTFGRDGMSGEYGEQALSLKTGELSDVIEGKDGWYVLYCVSDFDEEKTLEKKESMIAEEQDRIFQGAYREWSKSYEVLVSDGLWNQMQLS